NRDGTNVWPLDIVGIYAGNTKDVVFGASILVNYDYVDEGRSQSKGTSSIYLVRVADPRSAGEIAQRIDKLFANSPYETKTMSEQQLVADSVKQIGDIGFVVNSIVAAVFFALLFSVGAVMMQSIRERIPELAVLKTLGYSDAAVALLVGAESLLLCASAGVLGLIAAWLALKPAAHAIASVLPLLRMTQETVIAGVVFALALGLVSAIVPVWQSARLTIVAGLARR
ncbi:MAG TPA: ABC transporter permease, partial [Nevskiaceae bacterium]|nr:ABC transporter permease [Nevskiaceae bacterium]